MLLIHLVNIDQKAQNLLSWSLSSGETALQRAKTGDSFHDLKKKKNSVQETSSYQQLHIFLSFVIYNLCISKFVLCLFTLFCYFIKTQENVSIVSILPQHGFNVHMCKYVAELTAFTAY